MIPDWLYVAIGIALAILSLYLWQRVRMAEARETIMMARIRRYEATLNEPIGKILSANEGPMGFSITAEIVDKSVVPLSADLIDNRQPAPRRWHHPSTPDHDGDD